MIILSEVTTLQLISTLISIITPSVLFIWFIYSQKQYLSQSYFKEISGIYAGYCDSINDKKNVSGIILNIRDIDNKGYFKGELQFKEIKRESVSNDIVEKEVISNIHSFIGKLNHRINYRKKRNPIKTKNSRFYKGSFYIVDRLDFDFEKYDLNDYIILEYDILHFREIQTFKFKFKNKHKNNSLQLPEKFKLQKSLGLDFEPYNNLKKSVFNNNLLIEK